MRIEGPAAPAIILTERVLGRLLVRHKLPPRVPSAIPVARTSRARTSLSGKECTHPAFPKRPHARPLVSLKDRQPLHMCARYGIVQTYAPFPMRGRDRR